MGWFWIFLQFWRAILRLRLYFDAFYLPSHTLGEIFYEGVSIVSSSCVFRCQMNQPRIDPKKVGHFQTISFFKFDNNDIQFFPLILWYFMFGVKILIFWGNESILWKPSIHLTLLYSLKQFKKSCLYVHEKLQRKPYEFENLIFLKNNCRAGMSWKTQWIFYRDHKKSNLGKLLGTLRL